MLVAKRIFRGWRQSRVSRLLTVTFSLNLSFSQWATSKFCKFTLLRKRRFYSFSFVCVRFFASLRLPRTRVYRMYERRIHSQASYFGRLRLVDRLIVILVLYNIPLRLSDSILLRLPANSNSSSIPTKDLFQICTSHLSFLLKCSRVKKIPFYVLKRKKKLPFLELSQSSLKCILVTSLLSFHQTEFVRYNIFPCALDYR